VGVLGAICMMGRSGPCWTIARCYFVNTCGFRRGPLGSVFSGGETKRWKFPAATAGALAARRWGQELAIRKGRQPVLPLPRFTALRNRGPQLGRGPSSADGNMATGKTTRRVPVFRIAGFAARAVQYLDPSRQAGRSSPLTGQQGNGFRSSVTAAPSQGRETGP
jgi:hypothetical protein